MVMTESALVASHTDVRRIRDGMRERLRFGSYIEEDGLA